MKSFFIARFFSHIDYWLILGLPFMLSRGLDVQQAFTIFSCYKFFTILLEFPTGVIGDYFGHKTSCLIGQACFGISFIILVFSRNFWMFVVAVSIRALGSALKSGSYEAFVSHVSQDFKKDFANIGAFESIVLFVVAISTGLLQGLGMEVLIGMGAVSSVIAVLVMSRIKVSSPHSSQEPKDNMFQIARQGIKYTLSSPTLIALGVIFIATFGYGRSVKELVQLGFDIYNIDLTMLGIFAAAAFLASATGKFLSKHISSKQAIYSYILIVIFLIISYLAPYMWVYFSCLVVTKLLASATIRSMQVRIVHYAPKKQKASVLSFIGLLSSGFGSTYLFLFGYVVGIWDAFTALLLSGLIMAIMYGVHVHFNKLATRGLD